MAMQDYYEGQRWKEHPGVDKVVLWCVRAIEVVLPLTMSQLLRLLIIILEPFLRKYVASNYSTGHDSVG